MRARAFPVLPAPGGRDLVITIECTSQPGEQFGTLHTVAIHHDWTCETPHDLTAERVAQSFGGWSTCLAFADHVIPAYRRAVAFMANPDTLPTHVEGPVWPTTQTDERAGPANTHDAVRLAISPDGVFPARSSVDVRSMKQTYVKRRLYQELFAHGGRAWAASGDPHQIVGGAEGFLELWPQGLLPSHVAELARSILRTAWPLPPVLYSKMHSGEIDIDWLAAVTNCYPEREFTAWAATLESGWNRIPVETVSRLHRLGLSAHDAIGVLEERVPIETLTDLSNRSGVGGPTAARWLTVWARLGVSPSPRHYRLLEQNRVLLERPASWMLDSATQALRRYGPGAPDRTELAVMLALTSDQGLVADAVRRGIRYATDDRFMRMLHPGRTK